MQKEEFLDYFKHRKLRFDILTVFLSLFALSFAFVIIFTYQKTSKSILAFSQGEIERTSAVIVEKINELVQDAQYFPEITQGFLENTEHPSLNNPEMRGYMLEIVKDYSKIYAFYIAKSDGSYIEVNSLALNGQTHFNGDPSKKLPPGALYSFHFIDRSGTVPIEKWEYLNENLVSLAQEEISNPSFDPRQRPWYLGAQTSGHLFWTDVYDFIAVPGAPATGITIANPVFDPSGKLLYVIGLDITVSFLESFLAQQKVGKTGLAVLLNSSGQLIIPKQINSKQEIGLGTISQAFDLYSKEGKQNFIFDSKGIKYLAFLKPFPVHIGKEWVITILVPLNDYFGDLIHTQILISVISLLILIFGSIVVIYFSKKISNPIVTLSGEIDKIRQLNLESNVRVQSNIKEIQIMDSSIASMRAALASFGRYVPKEVVKQLIQKGHEIVLGGEKKEITVFVSDIAGFTSIAETISTDLLISLLAEYFGLLSKIVLDQGGTIDKYIGDSIMAFWNAPLDIPDHPIKACETALMCEASLRQLNENLKTQGRPELITRIGINTGTAFIGNIGTRERMNYTTIGDVVNVAHRLEKVAKEYHVSIVIGQDVYEKTKEQFLVRPLDKVAVKGRKEKIEIYELVAKINGGKEIAPSPEQIELCQTFTEGYKAFYQGELDKAKKIFKSILERFPQDFPTQLFLEKLKDF